MILIFCYTRGHNIKIGYSPEIYIMTIYNTTIKRLWERSFRPLYDKKDFLAFKNYMICYQIEKKAAVIGASIKHDFLNNH